MSEGSLSDAANKITILSQGPIEIDGPITVVRLADGASIAASSPAYFCRCGQSANKPFCDGAHKKAGFADPGKVSEVPAKWKEVTAAAPGLQVRLRPNGPLSIVGKFKLTDGAGAVAWSGNEMALCRCGASKNKPFCDGSHRDCGFAAE